MDRLSLIQFSDELSLNGEVIYGACLKALGAIENELPEEARVYSVYCHVIESCKEVLREMKVIL